MDKKNSAIKLNEHNINGLFGTLGPNLTLAKS